MLRLLLVFIGLAYTLPSCMDSATAQPTMPVAMLLPTLKASSAGGDTIGMQMAKLDINVSITGNVATTIYDIQFYNPADKVLEGEFEFPLADGQNIIRYALDINGSLREGVVVEKAKARAAVENTIRRKIDPGLVEKTKGNNFRTRIYPIPAKGYKHILIGIEQPLTATDRGLSYKIPLLSEKPLQQFGLAIRVFKTGEKPELPSNLLPDFAFTKDDKGWLASYHTTQFAPDVVVECIVPEKEDAVYTESFEGRTYFYVHTQIPPQYQSKTRPSSIAILWDISASAEKRNTQKEQDLITNYCRQLNNVTIDLIPFNITTMNPEKFVIQNGDASQLIHRIASYEKDGGTQLGAIDLRCYTEDEILIFTDGLSTFGKEEIQLGTTPVTLINSSPNPDYANLKWIARQTQGNFIDLNTVEPNTALDEMEKKPLHFINAIYHTNELSELYAQTNSQLKNGFSFAGILQKDAAAITLHFGYGKKITTSKTILIKDDHTDDGNVKRLWAGNKIAQLEMQYEKNKEAITQLGKQFSLVTRNTSLLVLDRVADYVQYEIVPPAELQSEYYTLLKEKHLQQTDAKATAMAEATEAMNETKKWYYHKINTFARYKYDGIDYDRAVVSESGTGTVVPPPPPQVGTVRFTPPKIVADDELKEDEKPQEMDKLETAQIGTINQEGVKDEGVVAPPGEDGLEQVMVTTSATPARAKSTIDLKEWNPDVVYLKELQKTPASQYRATYFLLKQTYSAQPSFYIDVARFFYANNNKPLALQALSNIAEMKLENPELLRMVANQLIEFCETALAVDVLTEVLNIREEEPQSYRDLALACNETGQYQQAVDLLYKVVTGNWDSRFGSVKAIALNEMNAIISAHRGQLDISRIDKQFIQPMQMDVRIVIGWSANDCDIDLWVTDPAKEKCSYENMNTHAGGRISSDVTQGYGPEEFCVRKAINGNYLVDVNLYGDSRQTLGGPITIKAELFTNFGRPNQQRKMINCRLTTHKEVIRIGTLKFGSRG